MRTSERDTLLLLLAIASGSADGWSYLALGHAFVANMTGNTVLLGIGIFGEKHDLFYPLIALICYAIGAAAGTFFTRRVTPGTLWTRSVSITLLLEALLLIGAEAVWFSVRGAPSQALRRVLLGCVAAGIGLQSGALLPLRIPGIVTTYITGTWTTLVSELVLVSSGVERVRRNEKTFEERLQIQFAFLSIYFVSAVTVGWVFHNALPLAGAIAAIPILLVATYGLIRG